MCDTIDLETLLKSREKNQTESTLEYKQGTLTICKELIVKMRRNGALRCTVSKISSV